MGAFGRHGGRHCCGGLVAGFKIGLGFVGIGIGLVWMAELMNTAVEAVVDLVSPEFNPLAKVAKDTAAAAVLAASLAASVVGLLVFGPPLWGVLFV